MDHNNFQDKRLNQSISKKLYKDGKLTFPFKTTLSFEPLIRQWKHIAKNGSKLERKTAEFLLDLINHAKNLREPITDLKVLESHREEVNLMMRSVFPAGAQDQLLGAAIVPYQIEAFYCTDKLEQNIQLNHDTFLAATNLTPESGMMFRTISACMAILQDYYGLDVVEKHPMTLALPDKKTGTMRHYAIDFYTSFVDIKAIGNVRKITQNQVKELMSDFLNVDRWLKLIPPHKFQFSGFAVMNLLDVTYQEVISSLKMDLLEKNAIITRESVESIQEKVRTLLGSTDIRMGIGAFSKSEEAMINYGNAEGNMVVMEDSEKLSCATDCNDSIYARVIEGRQPMIIDNLARMENRSSVEDHVLEKGYKNLVVAPLIHDNEVVGLLELASKKAGLLTHGSIIELKEFMPLMSLAIWRVADDMDNRIQATIKEKYTVIHPTVEWRFVQAASNYLSSSEGSNAEIDEIVFKDVYPLYGLSDIRGSSSQRSKAIQEDLVEHLTLARKVLEKGYAYNSMPIIQELMFRISNTMMNIRYGLKSGDEVNVLEFIREEIDPFIRNMQGWNSEMSAAVEDYQSNLDKDLGVLYKKRKEFEQSLMRINDMIATYMEKQQVEAQKMFPHYYEMYKTDGVDYNIYVGQSLVQNKQFDEIYLRNLRLWQFITMVEITRKAEVLKKKLKNPLEIAQLILAQSSPLSIRFRTDEKQFDVDGAYNIRYEIVKKRIDKVKIKDTNERLTQPGKIAIVYSHAKEAQEYMKYIKYLQSIDLVQKDVENLELEELQGASGLNALRITVNLVDKAARTVEAEAAKKDIEDIMQKIEVEM